MSDPYEEFFGGEVWLRFPPGPRHEAICGRLRTQVARAAAANPAIHLLPVRDLVEVRPGTMVRPDLALVRSGTRLLWLVVEVVDAADHRPDTVTKKGLYEEIGLPHLWVVDPRYDNVEVYARGTYGLTLQAILAGQDRLGSVLLPGFGVTMAELFAAGA